MKVHIIAEQSNEEILRLAIFIYAIRIQQPIKYRALMDYLSYLEERHEDKFSMIVEKQIENLKNGA